VQAYTSQPDMTQLYLRFAQQQQADEGFNRGLGLLAASAYPGRNPNAIMSAMTGNTADPGALFGNLVKLQQYRQQQIMLQNTQAAVPGLVKAYNADPAMIPILQNNPDMVSSFIQAHQPEGTYKNYTIAEDSYVKANSNPNDPQSVARARTEFEQKNPLVNALTPMGGDPELNAFNLEHTQYLSTHGGQEPDDGRFSDPQALKNWKAHNTTLSNTQTAASNTFPALNGNLLDMRNKAVAIAGSKDLQPVLDMAQNPLLLNAARNNDWLLNKLPTSLTGGLTQDQLDLLHQIDDLSAYNTSGMKSSNPHLISNILPIEGNLGNLTKFGVGAKNYQTNAQSLIDSIDTARAQAIGASGQLDKAVGDPNVEGKIDRSYLPGGTNYLGEPKKLGGDAVAWATQQLKAGLPPNEIVQRLRLKGYNPKPGQIPGVI
jgi:hypothetical protein